ncbi:MAG: alpha/beta hydrolase [Candidatus Cloacimonetes bacterium]|nr:alpha/beta hydrolase [Candidatus Cloacimonadota bacterium]
MSTNKFLSYEFGEGEDLIVVLPSLMDSFKSCLDNQKTLNRTWKTLSKEYRILFISRPQDMTFESIEQIASTIIEYIPRCKAIIGISMGGLIAQHIINKDPNITDHLILAMSCSHQLDTELSILKNWLAFAQQDDWTSLQQSTLEVIYNKPYNPDNGLRLIAPKPRSKQLLVNSIKACIHHNSTDFIRNIETKTLIIACEFDRLFPLDQMKLFTTSMKNSMLYILKDASHGMHGKILTEMQCEVRKFLK